MVPMDAVSDFMLLVAILPFVHFTTFVETSHSVSGDVDRTREAILCKLSNLWSTDIETRQ